MESCPPLPSVPSGSHKGQSTDTVTEFHEVLCCILGTESQLDIYLVPSAVDDLIKVMIVCSPAAGSTREIRENPRHLLRCKTGQGTVAFGQILLDLRPRYGPLPQNARDFREPLFLFIPVLQIWENRIADGITPLCVELCHTEPVRLICDAYILQCIRNTGRFILVGPLPG